jgi:hypothetical protein
LPGFHMSHPIPPAASALFISSRRYFGP